MRARFLAAAGAALAVSPATAAAAPAAAPIRTVAPPVTGFISAPTEQLAVPGNLASGEITPEGDIYTGWAEYEPLIGPRLRPFDQPTRVAPDPSLPLYQAQRRQGSLQYVERVFTVQTGVGPVAELTFAALNAGARPQPARIALQLEYERGTPIPTFFPGVPASPYRFPRPLGSPAAGADDGHGITEPGVAFDPTWTYVIDGRDVSRDGALLVRGPAASASLMPTGPADAPTSPHAGLGSSATVPAHGTRSWTWQIPLDPPPAGPAADAALDAEPPAVAQASFTAAWRAAQAGEMSISLPEARIDDVYHESLVDILAARETDPDPAHPGWWQAVNKFQYQGYWLRDSAIMTVALDQSGLHALAAQNLTSLPDWQQPDGQYISQAGQLDGNGEALWELAEHALLSGDPAAARAALVPVAASVNWVATATAADPRGLLPPATVGDDEFLTDAYITGNELWAAVGLRSAVALAQLAGRPDLVAAWQQLDDTFEAHLRAALAADQAAHRHITPALDQPGGNDWGNYNLDYPDEIVPPHSAAASDTIAWERRHSTQGLADYAHPGFLHGYLGYPIFQAELQREGAGVAQALNGLYAETVHTTASGAGWEDGPRGERVRASTDNLGPHGTFSGQYVSLLHNLLVDDTGHGIVLARGVSPAWMAPGDRIAVARAATSAGPVTYTLRTTATGATLRWSIARFAAADPAAHEPLSWALPYWVAHARLPDGRRVTGAVALRGDRGSLTVRFTAHRPGQSLTAAVAGLNRTFTASGHAPPLHRAGGW